MRFRIRPFRAWVVAAACALHGAQAQRLVTQPRVTQPVDDTQTVKLPGSLSPQASAGSDLGAVAAAFPAERMVLMLQRSPQQESALQAYLAAVQDPRSGVYRQFLTPQEFGLRYGVGDADLQAVVAWLQAKGFRVERVRSGRTDVQFSGTAAQVQAAFHTQIHAYGSAGQVHYANATAPEIPAALAPVVAGLVANNFGPHDMHRTVGQATLDAVSHAATMQPGTERKAGATPLYNLTGQYNSPCLNGYCFAVTPGDFAAIYDTRPLLSAGVDGTGVTIGVVGISNIDLGLVQQYRENFLPAYAATNLPNVIVDGPDPGLENEGTTEAYLDVEVAGSVAPNATVDLYIGADSFVSNGLALAIARALDDNQASILSVSYGECEAYLGATYNAYYAGFFEQAAAQGMTVLVSTGDSGSAACDPPYDTSIGGSYQAVSGLFVNGLASTPYNVAVGGTDFYYPANATLSTFSAYWNTPTSANPNNNADWSSAKGYIPEKPWNLSDPVLDQVNLSSYDFGGAGGGASSCISYSGTLTPGLGANPALCGGGYPKPAWQTGFGSDSVRDLPDVSLFASNDSNFSFTAICAYTGNCAVPNSGPNSASAPLQITGVGGTSVSAPAMAGIMALVVQKTKSRQGQANNVLYPLSKSAPSAFHDIAVGTIAAGCVAGSPNCGTNGYLTGYSATAGYDLATGLGSVDAALLVNRWPGVSLGTTATTLAISPGKAVHGTALSFTVNVTGGPSGGDVAILNTSTSGLGQFVKTCTAFPCTFMASDLPGGSYNVSARYAGGNGFAASTSTGVAVTISPESSALGIFYEIAESATTGQQVSNLNGQTDLTFGGIISFTAVPYPVSAGVPANPLTLTTTPATGTVTVSDNGLPVGSPLALDAAGKAVFEDFDLPVGTHSLTAAYSGDGSYTVSTTVSPVATPMVFTIGQAPVALYVEPYYQTVVTGSSATVTVEVSGNGPVNPTGTVTVWVISPTGVKTTLPAATLATSTGYPPQATFPFPPGSLGNGNNSVYASYSGDANYLPVTGTGNCTIVSTTAPTQVDVYTTPYAPVQGQSTTVTALVVRDLGGATAAGFPTGTVTMTLDGTTALGTFTPGSDGQGDGIVSYTTSSLALGFHSVSAAYGGDTGDLASSGQVTFLVAPATVDFTLSATPVVLPGASSKPSALSTLTMTLNGPLTNSTYITLTCSANTSALACTVPASGLVSGYAATGTVSVTVSVPGGTAMLAPYGVWTWSQRSAVVLALMLPLALLRHRGTRRAWLSLLCLAALAGAVTACGGGGSTIQGPLAAGSYSVTVTGVLGSATHQTTVAVTVQ